MPIKSSAKNYSQKLKVENFILAFACYLLLINVTYHCRYEPINPTKQELCNSRRFNAVRSYDVRSVRSSL